MSILCVVEREPGAALAAASWLAERLALPLRPVHIPNLTPAVAEAAEQAGAELIVVPAPKEPSSHWCSAMLSLLVAARRPVLIARESTAFEGWAKGVRPLSAIADFDFTPSASRVVHWVERLALVGPVELVLVHEYESARAVRSEGAGLQSSPHESTIRASLEREVSARMGALQGDLALRVRVEAAGGPRGRTIGDRACEEMTDLIAIAVDVRHLRARGLLRDALVGNTCCVLCVPVMPPRMLS